MHFRTILLNKFFLIICGILLLAIFFRFYNYENRWGLGPDQARDAMVVRYAVIHHEFPLIGPFSASGAFVFGSTWYLIFSFFEFLHPASLLTPWIAQSILFVFLVGIMIYIGYLIGGKKLAIILGAITAVSPSQIEASTNLIFSSFENVVSACVLLSMVYVFKKKKTLAFFFLGFTIALAITIHFQALPLIILFPLCLFLAKPNVKQVFLMIFGFLIPFIPLIVFDIQTHFFETKNLFSYFFTPKTSPQPDKRWLTYAFSFWPTLWSEIAGGFPLFGYLHMLCLCGVLVYVWIQKKIAKTMIATLAAFLLIFIALRYFSGELFESFISFFQPFLLLIIAWIYGKTFSLNKYFGGLLLTGVLLGSIFVSFSEITTATNSTASEVTILQSFLEQDYPHKQYALYDYEYKISSVSLPLALFLYTKQETNARGMKIGISSKLVPETHVIYEIQKPYHVYLYELHNVPQKEIDKHWVLVNPRATYSSVEHWYRNE